MTRTLPLFAFLLSASAAAAMEQYRAPPPPVNPGRALPTGDQNANAPSKGASQAIKALQKAIQDNDAGAYPAALAAAKAAAKTKEDRYLIARLQLNRAFGIKDTAAISAAIDEIASAGVLDTPTLASLYAGLGSSLYSAKQVDAAATVFERAATLDPTNLETATNLAEVRFAQGRKADAVTLFQKVLASKIAAGQKPEEALYKRTFAVAYEGRLPVSVELGRQWVAAYPNATSWRNALAVYQNLNKPGLEQVLNLLRLMRATGALSNPVDFSLYATAAAEQGNYVEAQGIIDEGLSKQAVKPSDPVISEVIAGLKSKPIPTAADLDVAAQDAKTAVALVRVGDRYFGMGNYPKAAELYRRAETAPGADLNLVNMHLGMALARSGDKAGAAAAFKKVGGVDAAIAQYWMIHVNQAG